MYTDTDSYRLDDISIAAYLLARGARITTISRDPTNPRHYFFIFKDKEKCESLKNEYLNNGSVSARELLTRREELISEMKATI